MQVMKVKFFMGKILVDRPGRQEKYLGLVRVYLVYTSLERVGIRLHDMMAARNSRFKSLLALYYLVMGYALQL